MDGLNFENMTFESLLNIEDTTYESSEYPELDLLEAVQECADIECEIMRLENAETMLEGAKLVKKAQSKKTKKKLKKSKMSAKAAKGRCKSGKVVKVTREDEDGNEEVLATGGTGPLPTTSDTGDLTQDDVEANKLDEVADATPDAEVTVTEIDEDAPAEEVVGTEGVDFIVEYESAAIVTYEASIKEVGQKIVTWIKQLFEKLIELWGKLINWLMKLFKVCAGYWKKHSEEIGKNFDTVKTQKVKVSGRFSQTFEKFGGGNAIGCIKQIKAELDKAKTGGAVDEDSKLAGTAEDLGGKAVEIEISKLFQSASAIETTFTDAPKLAKEMNATTKEVYKKLMADAKKSENKDTKKDLVKKAKAFNKVARLSTSASTTIQSLCYKVMRMCVKGGASEEKKAE